MKLVRHAVQGERCLQKRASELNEQTNLGNKGVPRMKRMPQSAQNSRSMQPRASDETEKGAEDRPRVRAELHVASPRPAHLLTRSSGFGRATCQ
jgi:hypothetical protein